ncbi:molybdopterin molybdotransferase MoeA [Alkaliphilus oremlandii]|uniref:Molybdopterin molybdenumtransferase n=1 Tax=Alkaliphilus oremlandii (strain OhILAs) TaxID=350688 RepID=A8MF51_ALKOO|nr:gephyrin-like molybdotransferase Glp [Alkaliphilus oremlandii]ABW18720.1 molybdenum cofactor synthesis domain [Alkaliphilus oremlandii OhILAs]
MNLLNTVTVDEAKNKIKDVFSDVKLKEEKVHLLEAVNRYLSQDIVAPIHVPGFHRSTVDGYAVIARDTFGSSENIPSFLRYRGKIEMGMEATEFIGSGECYYVPTGGMLPMGCDAVVMVEYTEVLGREICIQKPVSPWENILKKGEDLRQKDLLFKKGHRLRPQDIGMLAGLGIIDIPVYEKLSVSIISTGDELVPPTKKLNLGQIHDMNTYSLSAAAEADGCCIIERVIIEDEKEGLQSKIEECIAHSHIILISGGSSAGDKDYTKEVMDRIGMPGAFIHGISVKPGKPTIVGKVKGRAIFGLPGQPVSALIVYKILVSSWIKETLYGAEVIHPSIEGTISVNIPSAPGREHYVMVSIKEEAGQTIIDPIYGKSGMLSMMAKAQGYIKIHTNTEGILKGDSVRAFLL